MGSFAMRRARAYPGPERRRNWVLVTHHSEYHCHGGSCVAVRDRSTGEFVLDHPAIGKLITGGMRYSSDGGIAEVSPPEALLDGERLCFSACDGHLDRDVITSPLVAIELPPKNMAERYQQLSA
jgi:hypothetical protein